MLPVLEWSQPSSLHPSRAAGTAVPGVMHGGFAKDVPNCLGTSQGTLLGSLQKRGSRRVLSSCIHCPAAFKISVVYYYYYCYYLFFFPSIGPNPCQVQRVLSSQGDLICFKVENEHLSSTKENLQEFICQQGRFHLISAQFEITLALQLFIS